MDTLHFGTIPDVHDNDPKLIVFYSALQNYNGSSFDGYFSIYNQMTDSQAQMYNQRSNECEMIYMTCHPLDPSSYQRISVLSHELQHLIHWGADADEETWVDEGAAEYAMHLFGLPDPITDFHHNANNSLTSWDQHFSDYIQTYLFMDYLAENFGGSTILHDIVQEPLNSMAGIQQVLIDHGYMIPMNSVFTNWTVANFANDYQEISLPEFDCSYVHHSLPGANSAIVAPWACEYIKPVTGNDVLFTITANQNINVVVIKKMLDGSYVTETGIVNSQTGSLLVSNPSDSVEYIVLDIVNPNDNQASYSYSISEDIADEERFFNVYNYSGNFYSQLSATKRAAGIHCNVYVDNTLWQSSVYQADADVIVKVFEDSTAADSNTGIYELDTNMFGSPSDIDNNGKINILICDIDDASINGYFSPMDLEGGNYSNNMELIYLDNNPHLSGINSSYCFSTLAHEFQHLIHHNYDINEELWVNEGLSCLAQDITGWISTDWMVPFVMSPDNNLTLWEAGVDYPQTFLFMRYLYEHFNQDNRIIEHLVSSNEVSIAGINSALNASGYDQTLTAEDVYNCWVVANYINNPVFENGLYSYDHYPIGTGLYQLVNSREFESYPTTGTTGFVQNWGVDYYLFENLENDLKVTFSYMEENFDHHIQFIRFNNNNPIEILKYEPDVSNPIEFNISGHVDGTDSLCSEIAMIVSETSNGNGSMLYSFNAEMTTIANNDNAPVHPEIALNSYPNPFNPKTTINYSIDKDGYTTIEIYNLKGQLVKTLVSDYITRGNHVIEWNGTDNHNNSASSGVYFVRMKSIGKTLNRKITLLK